MLEGSYTFCMSSNDGSMLSIGGTLVVNNPSKRTVSDKCGVIDLSEGSHKVVVKYYDECCGVKLVATYAGPDTWDIQELIPSLSPQEPELPPQSQWTMRLFQATFDLVQVPQLPWLHFLGEAYCPAIDFHKVSDLDQYVPNVPSQDFAGAWYGQVEIVGAGTYEFCLKSKDGAIMHMDGERIIDDDGREQEMDDG